jgi:hypothetical protein
MADKINLLGISYVSLPIHFEPVSLGEDLASSALFSADALAENHSNCDTEPEILYCSTFNFLGGLCEYLSCPLLEFRQSKTNESSPLSDWVVVISVSDPFQKVSTRSKTQKVWLNSLWSDFVAAEDGQGQTSTGWSKSSRNL